MQVWEQRSQELKLAWAALRKRVESAVTADTPSSGGRSSSAGGAALLPAQQERILRALEQENGIIREAEAKLAVAEEEVTAWKEEHPEALLPVQLAGLQLQLGGL